MAKDKRSEGVNSKIPHHLGCILDGNRRLAKRLMLKPWEGHKLGAKKIKEFLEWCKEVGVKEVTLFAFSLDNFNRPKQEFDFLMNIFEKEFSNIKDDQSIYEDRVKINFIGRIEMFPEKVLKPMRELMERTKHHDRFIVNFAMAYGGRAEIVDAVNIMVRDVQEGKLKASEINEKRLNDYMYLVRDCDMIIRTGGDRRLSGFLLWRGEYSELFFINKFWPEFEKEDFLECINEFKTKERRFGR